MKYKPKNSTFNISKQFPGQGFLVLVCGGDVLWVFEKRRMFSFKLWGQ